jgi:hypothetical protein
MEIGEVTFTIITSGSLTEVMGLDFQEELELKFHNESNTRTLGAFFVITMHYD